MPNRMSIGIAVLALSAMVTIAAAQEGPFDQVIVDLQLDSGFVTNVTGQRTVIYSSVLSVPEVAWLRLLFDQAILGDPPAGGRPTVLALTSLSDGAHQTLTATHLEQWRFTSAYFNGGALLLEIVADPGAKASRVVISEVFAGPLAAGGGDSICGPTDDRIPSSDPRVARFFPGRCTVWLIDDANHCLLSAGHCDDYLNVVEFNAPLSSSTGDPQHPGPEDQYPYDPASVQSNGGQGVGDDWMYFGCFPNTQTGLTAYQAQGDSFELALPPQVTGQTIRITGYGITSSPIPPEWNRAQKTHTGPYVTFTGSTLQYQVDTTSGNSGSPVIVEDTGEAIGIHTHAGCNTGGGANQGTGSNHPGLQNALANPRGVCIDVPPQIVHGFQDRSLEAHAFSGYIDPRGESSDGQTLDKGLSEVTVVFTEAVRDIGGGDLTAAAFVVRETGGGQPPNVTGITTADNRVVTVHLDRIITLGQWTTIEANVEDMTGNEIEDLGDLGPGVDETDRVDIAFLPGDNDQNGSVQPLDNTRFRGMFVGATLPDRGAVEDYVDISRDGSILPLDLTWWRMLLTGQGFATQNWMGQTLDHPQP